MKDEKSCGAVVFTREYGSIRYVVIRAKSGACGFPKGHVEGNETERETALREIREETGLSVRLLPGFREEDAYSFLAGGEQIQKQVVYFLAEYAGQTPQPQETELDGLHLLDYSGAMAALSFESARKILRKAQHFLQQGRQIRIGDTVSVTVDRPLGSCHPKYPTLRYPVNYGFIPGTRAGDGEEQDVYILGVDKPVAEFTGRIIARICREDDREDKLVAAPEGMTFRPEEICRAVDFQERFFRSRICTTEEE